MRKKIIKKSLRLAIWLLATLFFFSSAIAILFLIQGNDLADFFDSYLSILKYLFTNLFFYIAWIFPYLFYLFMKHLIKVKHKRGWLGVARATLLIFILPVGLLFGAFRGVIWYNQYEDFTYDWNTKFENHSGESMNLYQKDGKHRGIHIFIRRSNREKELKEMVKNHVEWITMVPYSYQRDVLKPTLSSMNHERIVRRDSSFAQTIKLAKSMGMEAMMKPHIWVSGDMWRSEIAMDSEKEWDLWFKQYGDFILHYAKLASQTGCAALCIGTELRESVIQKPDKWRELIKEIKKVYRGKLVYAANWDSEYKKIAFWDELDYIGIQAYFELTDESVPSVSTINKGWKKTFSELKSFHEKWNKPILFTEIGYKSTMGAADKPWQWESPTASLSNKVSFEAQVNCYESLFQTFWDESWFAGVHLWKWEGDNEFDFTPKNKPAANIMAKWFGKQVDPVSLE